MTLLLSLAALAALALIAGGAFLVVRRGERRQGWLMIAAGAVTLFNLWSWGTLPASPEG